MKIFSYLAYLAVRGVYGLLRLLPQSWVYAIARCLGSMAYLLMPRLRGVARANIQQALGSQASESQVRRLSKEAFQHFATVSCEAPLLDKLLRPQNWVTVCEFPTEKLRELLSRNKGLLALGPHFGNWEVLSLSVGLAGFPNAVISRPLKNPYLVEYFRKMREAYGARLIPRRGGFRELLPVFRAGGMASMMPDQNQRKRPLFVSWFGKLAATDRSPAFVATRLGVPTVVMAAIRMGKEFRFRVEIEEIVPPVSTGDRDRDEQLFTEHMHRILEKAILRHPEQYFWLHERYRTRPSEES